MIHLKIWEDYREFLTDDGELSPEALENRLRFASLTHHEFCKAVFLNWTKNWPSLRCSFAGSTLLKNMYEHWLVEWDPEREQKFSTPLAIVALHRHMKAPYYLDSKGITLWGNEPALEITMAGGNIETWAKMF